MNPRPKVTMTAREFRQIRESKAMSQGEFGEYMGFTNNVIISLKETGKRRITLRDEKRLAPELHNLRKTHNNGTREREGAAIFLGAGDESGRADDPGHVYGDSGGTAKNDAAH